MRPLDAADLARMREARGLGLDALARQTRIPLRLLVDLEAGRFDRWPKGVYARAHLRAYAGAVGLDAESVIAVAPAPLLTSESVEQIRACHQQHARPRWRSFPFKPLTALATGAAFLLGGVAWTVVEQKSAGMEKPDDSKAEPQQRPASRPVATAGVRAKASERAPTLRAVSHSPETRARRTPRRVVRPPAPQPVLVARSIPVPLPAAPLTAKTIVAPDAPLFAPLVTPVPLDRTEADRNPLKKLGRGLRKVFVGR